MTTSSWSTDRQYTHLFTPVPTAGDFIALPDLNVDKYQTGCSGGTVRVFDARTGRVQRSTPLNCGPYPAFALAADGAPAWLGSDEQGIQHLSAAADDGHAVDLDSGPSGSLGALAASGTSSTWTHDGQPPERAGAVGTRSRRWAEAVRGR